MSKNTYGNQEDQLLQDIAELEFENAGLRVQMEQQAICNGKGSEREAALLAKVETLERDNAALRSAAVEVCALARAWVTVWGDKLSAESIKQLEEWEKKILKGTKP